MFNRRKKKISIYDNYLWCVKNFAFILSHTRVKKFACKKFLFVSRASTKKRS